MPPKDITDKPLFIFEVDTGKYTELKNAEFADITTDQPEWLREQMDRLAFIANMDYGQYMALYALAIPNNWLRMNRHRTIRQRKIWRLMRKNAMRRYRELQDLLNG